MSLVGKTYQWGSWDITFKEEDELESVGGYIGKGDYSRTDNILKYNIYINKTTYLFIFVNEQFENFTSHGFDKTTGNGTYKSVNPAL